MSLLYAACCQRTPQDLCSSLLWMPPLLRTWESTVLCWQGYARLQAMLNAFTLQMQPVWM
jgi:hypothetical protein